MPPRKQYLTRGSIQVCIDHMLTHWRANNDAYLSIVHHVTGKYYAVVTDHFLQEETFTPDDTGCRLMLRCTLKELKKLCTYYQATQTEMRI